MEQALEIRYANKKIKAVCTNATVAKKSHGQAIADKIHMRIDQIAAADSVEELIQYSIGKCHMLRGDREGQYAMHLAEPWRLVFTVEREVVQIACIIEIVDYH